MCWEDIDLKDNVISVNHTLSYKSIAGKRQFFITTPKTRDSIRTIPIIKDLRAQLISQKELKLLMGITRDFEIDGYKNFVFTTKKGTPFTPDNMKNTIKKIIHACNDMELEKANKEHREPVILPMFSAHTLRHTFCTRLRK